MITQTTGQKLLKPWQGLAVAALCILAVYAINALLSWLVSLFLPAILGTVLLWLSVIALFLIVLKRYGLSDTYTLDGVKMQIFRRYIRNPRFCEQVLYREIVFFGPPEAAARKYLLSRTRRYGSSRGAYAYQSVVYKRDGKYCQLLITPNEEVCAALVEAVKQK